MSPPGCNDYRAEMQLVELKRRLQSEKLTDTEKKTLKQEIRRMEKQIGLD